MSVNVPIHIMMTLLAQPKKEEAWMRRAAREYLRREIKKQFPESVNGRQHA